MSEFSYLFTSSVFCISEEYIVMEITRAMGLRRRLNRLLVLQCQGPETGSSPLPQHTIKQLDMAGSALMPMPETFTLLGIAGKPA